MAATNRAFDGCLEDGGTKAQVEFIPPPGVQVAIGPEASAICGFADILDGSACPIATRPGEFGGGCSSLCALSPERAPPSAPLTTTVGLLGGKVKRSTLRRGLTVKVNARSGERVRVTLGGRSRAATLTVSVGTPPRTHTKQLRIGR